MEATPPPKRSPMNASIALQRLNGSHTMLAALAGFFLEDAPQQFEQLREAVRSASLPQVARTAHGLRGLSATFEAIPVMQLTQEIERLAKNGEASGLHELVETLAGELARLTEVLRQVGAQK